MEKRIRDFDVEESEQKKLFSHIASPLIDAIEDNNYPLIESLIRQGNQDEINFGFIEAISRGNLSIINFLSQFADIHFMKEKPLRTAIIYQNIPIINFLFEKGANLVLDEDEEELEIIYTSVTKQMIPSIFNIFQYLWSIRISDKWDRIKSFSESQVVEIIIQDGNYLYFKFFLDNNIELDYYEILDNILESKDKFEILITHPNIDQNRLRELLINYFVLSESYDQYIERYYYLIISLLKPEEIYELLKTKIVVKGELPGRSINSSIISLANEMIKKLKEMGYPINLNELLLYSFMFSESQKIKCWNI